MTAIEGYPAPEAEALMSTVRQTLSLPAFLLND
jgi:hypothetical protein